jgi:hypothetical protein
VHILFDLGRTVSISEAVEEIKKVIFQMDQNPTSGVRDVFLAGGLRRVCRFAIECGGGARIYC